MIFRSDSLQTQCQLFACKCTAAHISLLSRDVRRNIEVEYVHWQAHSSARIRDINNAGNMPLHRCARQQQIYLVVIIAVPPQILNHPQTRLSIRHRRIKIVLLSVLINREPFKVDISPRAELRFDWSRYVDGALHIQLLDSAFHDRELNRNDTCHFNRTTEANLPISLTEMKISNAKLSTFYMHRKENLRSAAEILDITVPTMLRAAGNGARTLFTNLLLELRICRASMHIPWLRGLGDNAVVRLCAGLDQLAFALVPSCKDFGGGCAAEDAGVD